MVVPPDLDRRVRERADGRCEYCRLPQAAYVLHFQIDHIVARQHRGRTLLGNLALACGRCNRSKGPNISGIDVETHELVRLFHPRRDRWAEHFRWRGPRLVGLTSTGRATIHVLAINHPSALKLRRELMEARIFPKDSAQDRKS